MKKQILALAATGALLISATGMARAQSFDPGNPNAQTLESIPDGGGSGAWDGAPGYDAGNSPDNLARNLPANPPANPPANMALNAPMQSEGWEDLAQPVPPGVIEEVLPDAADNAGLGEYSMSGPNMSGPNANTRCDGDSCNT